MWKMLFCYLIWSSFMIVIRDNFASFLKQYSIEWFDDYDCKSFYRWLINFLSIAIFVIDSNQEKGVEGTIREPFDCFQQSDINRHNLLNPLFSFFYSFKRASFKNSNNPIQEVLVVAFLCICFVVFFLHAFFLSHTRTSMVKSRKSQLRDI